MRIISGKKKGKRLVAPSQLPVRPTTDFAKEALFNILNNYYYFEQLSVLDLFAGTGNIGYEFASRGSVEVVSVDNHYACTRYISKTAQELDFSMEVIKADVYEFLRRTTRKFDVIFADPPYDFQISKMEELVAVVFERQLLNQEGILIIEHTKMIPLQTLNYFSYDKRYGGSMFSFFEIPPTNDELIGK